MRYFRFVPAHYLNFSSASCLPPSYVIANHIGRLGHLSSAGTLYDTMLEFFTLNHKDVSCSGFPISISCSAQMVHSCRVSFQTAEYMISAYKFGAFHKVSIIMLVIYVNVLHHNGSVNALQCPRILHEIMSSSHSSVHTKLIGKGLMANCFHGSLYLFSLLRAIMNE